MWARMNAMEERTAALRYGAYVAMAILCEVRSAGKDIGVLVCFDDEPTSETCGQQVKNCPGCDEPLRLAGFYRKR